MSARILYVMSGRPWPYDRGDRIRNYNLLRALLPGNDVTLLTLDVEPSEALPDGLAACRRVSMEVPFWQQAIAALGHPGIPVTSARRSGLLLEGRVRRAIRGLTWDVVVAAQLRAVPVALALTGSPHVVDLTDSLWDLYSQDASAARTLPKRWFAQANAARARQYESFALSRAELATVSSETDATALRALGGSARIRVIPNGADIVTRNVDLASGHGVLFVGNCLYGPNLEGLLWFVREVWPLVRAVEPACTLDVVGSVQRRILSVLGTVPGVHVHGYVPEVGQFLSQAAVVINPVLKGSGTSLKSLEALAWGKALVTTPAGARSLGLVQGVEGLVAGTEQEFSAAVCRCLADPGLRSALGTAARRGVSERFAWTAVTERWRGLVMDIAEGAGSR